MKRSAIVLVALVSLAATAADDEKEKAVKEELAKLKGQWKQVSSEVAGKESILPPGLASVVTIEGNKWTMEGKGEKGKGELTFAIDPTQNPKHWNRIRKVSDGKEEKEVVDQCIYKLDGDTLTICSGRTPSPGGKAEDGKERPKEFKTAEGGSIVVYKRVEK